MDATPPTPCRACGHDGRLKSFTFQERQFGTGEQFEYFQCARCGCLQIAAAPGDLSPYYPAHYYSFLITPRPQTGLKARLAAFRDRAVLLGRGWLVRPVTRWLPASFETRQLGVLPLRPGMSILDVGCGRGELLSILWRAGFQKVAGIDPFLPEDREILPGLTARKLPIEEVRQTYDLIMLHHVLEHVPDPAAMLAACARCLAPQGRVLVRIPALGGRAWETYQEFWVGLDAPRHICLHTRPSMDAIAARAGLKVIGWRGENSPFHFYASELYRRGLPLFDRSGRETPVRESLGAGVLDLSRRQADAAAAEGRCDQVAVLLTPLARDH